MQPYLTTSQAQRFYDRFGARQDGQGFYEDAALAAMLAHIEWADVERAFEYGCGTGRLAQKILLKYLLADAHYCGCDLSQTMVDLARARLAHFGARATIWKSGAFANFAPGHPPYDLIVSTYVLDLLPPEQIKTTLAECARALRPGGQLALVSLTNGTGVLSRLTSGIWGRIAQLRPSLVGGCHPVDLRDVLQDDTWQIVHDRTVTSWTIPSEVLVARRL
jgi:SAM-dependent methyltransferase